MNTRSIATALVITTLAACSAAPNPARPEAPAPWDPSAPAKVEQKAQPADARPAAEASASSATPRETAAPAAAPAPARPGVDGDGSDLVIATVAGSAIDARELLRQWVHQNSIDVLEQLDRLVLSRFVLLEGRRLAVQVDPKRHDDAFAAAVAAIEDHISSSRPGVTLDQYVDQVLGLDPATYRETLRDDSLRTLLAERVMRAWLLESERAEVLVIVVKSEEKVAAVRAALAAGQPFDAVAREHSIDGSADDGGRVPPVVRADTVMGRLAFETPVGEVGGPQREQGAWLFIRVEARPPPLQGDWSAIAAAVESSLAERPIEDLELSQWKAAMLRRYEADITPFLRLVGQPVK